MKRFYQLILSGLLSLSLLQLSYGQNAAIRSITEKDLKTHLEFLSSDLLEGRRLGTPVPGLQIAAEYIKASASRIGLNPGGDDFFQSIHLVTVSRDPENTYLQVTDGQGKILAKSDSIFTFGGSADDLALEGKIVFAGYGWQDTTKGYDDFKGLDLKDKFVMVMSRNPEQAMKGNATGTGNERGAFNIEFAKITKATNAGAKGIIFVKDPLDTGGGLLSQVLRFGGGESYMLEGQEERRSSRRPSNMFFITPSMANSILATAGKSLADLQAQINSSGKPASFELANVSGKINLAKKRKPVPAGNIIGVIEGSDPELKKECIVYCAHYDHLGKDRDGEVYNGADDNASGVAGLLEIAEAFVKLEKKPKRSIVFAWVTGEEIGLFGSQYYSQHPLFPMQKTVASLNLDMIGRVKADGDTAQFIRGEKNLIDRNGVYVITGRRSAELDSINSKICKEMGLHWDSSMSDAYINRSDYAHFHRMGVPILGFSTGVHVDYHRVTDEISKIDFPKMRVVTELAFRVGYEVANKKDRIVVDKPLENK
jgi:hypothetical protein